MPLGDRFRRRHEHEHGHEHGPRIIRQGGSYTRDEEIAGEIELAEVPPLADPPPEETRGEPWGWTKGPPYPLGWRKDGRYGPD